MSCKMAVGFRAYKRSFKRCPCIGLVIFCLLGYVCHFLVRSQGDQHSIRMRDFRDKSDGYFRSAGNHLGHVFLFSAFWDDRWSVGPQPVIRVLAIMETTNLTVPYGQRKKHPGVFTVPQLLPHPVFCLIECRNLTAKYHVRVESDDHVSMGPFRVLRQHTYGRYIFSCIQKTCTANHWEFRISLGYEVSKRIPTSRRTILHDHNSVPVEFPAKPEDPSDVLEFATCHPVAFNHLDPTRLVEWLEMQRILGIGKVIMYNDSLDESTSRVLRHYESEGFMEVRQTRPLFVTEDGSLDMEDYGARNGISVSDCMYRHMYRVKYFMSLDADEVIVPRISHDLRGLVEDIRRVQLGANTNVKVASCVFRNMDFIADVNMGANPDESKPWQLHYLRYSRRHPVSDPNRHPKIIVDAMGCVAMNQHHCRRLTDAFNTTALNTELPVDPTLGALHHYRGSLCDLKRPSSVNCDKGNIPVLNDTRLFHYENVLWQNVARRLNLLGLESF